MTNTLSVLVNSMSVIFFTIGLGWACKQFGYVPSDSSKGIGPQVGKICLPMLIFRNVAKLDISTINYKIVGVVAIVKIVSLVLAVALTYVYQPKDDGSYQRGDKSSNYGINTLFCTGSNDLAVGLPIIMSLYPVESTPVDFTSITFVIVGMQVGIFNIPSFVMLEMGNALRAASAKDKDSKIDGKKLAALICMNMIQNPVILSTFLGILYTLIFPPTPGDTSTNRNIPYLFDQMLQKGGSAFGMSALFLAGMAVVGKFKLLRGKGIMQPVLLSLIKILVAPIVGYYVTLAVFHGDPLKETYANYVFVYGSLPTAGSIIVFAQQYDIASKDMISGGAVLVLLLWAPLMLTTATLLHGGEVGQAGISFFSHFFSVFAGLSLMVTGYISPDWQTHPKILAPLLGFSCFIYSIASIGCVWWIPGHASIHGYVRILAGSVPWYVFTWFGRVLLRVLLGFVVPTDLIMLWVKGKSIASTFMPYTATFAVLFAAISTFTYMGNTSEASTYACWYRYGDGQIIFEIILIIMTFSYKAVVLVWVTCKPSKLAASKSLLNELEETVTKDSIQSTESISLPLSSDDPNYDSKKCGVSGGYVYRLKLLLGISATNDIFQMISSVTQLSQTGQLVPTSHPIIDLVSLLNIFTYDASGVIILLIFSSMKTHGWVKLHSNMLKYFRSMQILNLFLGEGTQDGASTVPAEWIYLANRLVSTDVVKARTFEDQKYESTVRGHDLLKYLVTHDLAVDADTAQRMCVSLIKYDLLHHITYEFGEEELNSSALFVLVRTEAPEQVVDRKNWKNTLNRVDLSGEIHGL